MAGKTKLKATELVSVDKYCGQVGYLNRQGGKKSLAEVHLEGDPNQT